MAVTYSHIITDVVAGNQVERGSQGFEKVVPVQYTATGAIANNDIVALCYIPVEAKITSVKMWSDDLGTTGALNLGFYPGNADVTTLTDASAVDEDALATAIDVNTAATANVEVRFEVKDINTIDDRAWEIAGLSARPAYDHFLLAFTASAATTDAGDISVVVRYID